MLNRREFLKQAGIALAGGVAAASGIAMIAPAESEVAHPLSEAWLEAGNAMMNGMIEGIKLGEATSGTAQAVDDFTVAVRRQSLMIPYNMGIPITQSKLNEAYQNYASALNKTDWQLTDHERQMAYLTAFVEAANAQG